ncbi:DASS family sodium-coupled anion symporter [Magnetovibrio sp.]|uniref:SLC13 family permease n=1 Tax=Magnetovibrio sp. TaxID=2024836 RepID=UPI002F93F660
MTDKRNPPPPNRAANAPVSPETIPASHAHHTHSQRLPAWFGIVLGIALFVAMRLLPPPGDMSANAWAVAAVAILMATWWLTEAIPVAATALVPLALFPLLGQGSIKDVATPYANPLIFLFLGGFLIALAVERWGLHKRMALFVLSRAGTRPRQLVGAFMITAAGLSMWISNTASTVMMLPIALSVIGIVAYANGNGAKDGFDGSPFAKALLIATAYGASMGGVATLVGTPPNALLAGFVSANLGVQIGFAQWMVIGVPTMVLMLVLGWLIVTRAVFRLSAEDLPGASQAIAQEAASLPSFSRAEKMVSVVFGLTATLWMTRPLLQKAMPWLSGLSDAGIAITAGVVLFAIPVSLKDREFLLNWDWAKRLPWGVLILFGGGLSLASQVAGSGLAAWIGEAMTVFSALPLLLTIVLVTTVIVFLTELTSNTATTATFLPVIAALAAAMGTEPMMLLVPAALGASMAFMMPVATPPNAIVFGGGHLTIPDMARAGFMVNLAAIAVITGLVWMLAPILFAP